MCLGGVPEANLANVPALGQEERETHTDFGPKAPIMSEISQKKDILGDTDNHGLGANKTQNSPSSVEESRILPDQNAG